MDKKIGKATKSNGGAAKTGDGINGAYLKKSDVREIKASKRVGEALLKAALGCRVAEVTEEYAEVDGELKLLKRKKTKKDIPPDLKAVQLLLETGEKRDVSALSDEELEEEKRRLLRVLYESENVEILKACDKTLRNKKPTKRKTRANVSATKKSGARKATDRTE